MLPISLKERNTLSRRMETQRFKTFFWRLGFDVSVLGGHTAELEDVPSTLFDVLPVPKESLRPCLRCCDSMCNACIVLQGSMLVDNWTALEAGQAYIS